MQSADLEADLKCSGFSDDVILIWWHYHAWHADSMNWQYGCLTIYMDTWIYVIIRGSYVDI